MSELPSIDSVPSAFADIPRLLAAAPHRPLFLAGTIVVLLNMVWWAVELSGRYIGVAIWPQPTIQPLYGHGMLIQYGLFPLLMFGFLMTTFPRWLCAGKRGSA